MTLLSDSAGGKGEGGYVTEASLHPRPDEGSPGPTPGAASRITGVFSSVVRLNVVALYSDHISSLSRRKVVTEILAARVFVVPVSDLMILPNVQVCLGVLSNIIPAIRGSVSEVRLVLL